MTNVLATKSNINLYFRSNFMCNKNSSENYYPVNNMNSLENYFPVSASSDVENNPQGVNAEESVEKGVELAVDQLTGILSSPSLEDKATDIPDILMSENILDTSVVLKPTFQTGKNEVIKMPVPACVQTSENKFIKELEGIIISTALIQENEPVWANVKVENEPKKDMENKSLKEAKSIGMNLSGTQEQETIRSKVEPEGNNED